MSNYYESSDLARFADVGTHNRELMDKFFEYYNMATSTEGALTKREKQLIGLAVAHTIQCPYCIDAYTTGCLESGADPAQMTEAIHVVGAVRGGASLVHGVQMLNVLEKVGA
jgi:alkylhydroperoxidase/carboxymuconolactone decarboxylase family protein